MTIDVARVRGETPGCAEVVHLNNSGASLMPAPVVDAMVAYLGEEARSGGYETADRHATELEAVYASVARLLAADRTEIAVVDNATTAWQRAFHGMRFAAGDRILTTTSEYASNAIAYRRVAERTGALIEVVPDAASGEIDVAALEAAIDDRVRLITINHVPTHSGLVNPAAAVGAVARRHKVPYLLDACQSVGQMPVDVTDIGCDMLSGTSRKFLRGPRGVGFLYVRSGFLDRLDPPVLDLHAARWVHPDGYEMRPDARRFETWESNLAAKLGFGVAVGYALDLGLDAIWERCRTLGARLRNLLTPLPGVAVHDRGAVQGAIVSFTVAGVEAPQVQIAAGRAGINVSVSSPSSAPYDIGHDVVRAAPHYFNTDAELEALATVVARL